jgi:undecaprenyl diphosphate synthase
MADKDRNNSEIPRFRDSKIPRHVAVIMDGNGRWAQARGLPRSMGHKAGADAVKRTVKAAAGIGISYLTLFGFSSENWKRPPEEVNELMRLLRIYLRGETADLHRNNVRLRVIGNREPFEGDIVELIENAEKLTNDNDGVTVTIALNYGGRHDIMQAAAKWAQMCRAKGLEPGIDHAEEFFPQFLMTSDMPDPDILIRASGEQRISNFLLWQCAYAELYFTPTLWPDFSGADLEAAVNDFNRRERRFGAIRSV